MPGLVCGRIQLTVSILHREYAEMTSIRYVDLRMEHGDSSYHAPTAPSTVTVEQ